MRLLRGFALVFFGVLLVASAAVAQDPQAQQAQQTHQAQHAQQAQQAQQALRVMTSGMFTEAHLLLSPQFERDTGRQVVTVVTTLGVGENAIPKRLERGEPVDVVIMSRPNFDGLLKAGLILPDSLVNLARSGIGMAVRAGAPKPDISTPEALKRVLLNAKSIAYSAHVSGTHLIKDILPKLGIVDQVMPKTLRADTERVGALVARGDAEIGFQQMSELLPIKGVEVVGPLPAELQHYSVATAGIPTYAKHKAAARAYIKFLASPRSAAEVKKSGLELLPTARPARSALAQAKPGDVRMLVTGAIAGPIEDVREQMEQVVGHRIIVQYGSARGNLRTEILGGQGFEVAILLPDVTDELRAAGKVTSEYVDVARVQIGIGIRGDVPPIDVSTPAAIKAAMLGAKALEWSPTGVAIKTANKIVDTLGLQARVAAIWHPSRQPVPVPLGPGEYELQIFPVSEIIDRKVARNMGPVIPEFQVPQVIRAVISANTPESRSAEAVLQFLKGPEITAVLAKHGMTR